MKQKIYRQFKAEDLDVKQVHKNLSNILSENGIQNIVKRNSIIGQLNDLKIKVKFSQAIADTYWSPFYVEMKGKITAPNYNEENMERSKEILNLLAQYEAPQEKNK